MNAFRDIFALLKAESHRMSNRTILAGGDGFRLLPAVRIASAFLVMMDRLYQNPLSVSA